MSEHVKLEKGWFSGYPEGRVKLPQGPSGDKPLFMYVSFDNLQGPQQVEERWKEMYPYQVPGTLRNTPLHSLNVSG